MSDALSFTDKLTQRIEATDSHLCIGLDPRPHLIQGDVSAFLKQVIAETQPYAAAFKPNIAYFEAMGWEGYRMLEETLSLIPCTIPVILDVKRSDIPETQAAYARAYFQHLQVDAVTLNPLLGRDSIEPFLYDARKGVYLLGITSNLGAHDFLLRTLDGRPMIQHMEDLCIWTRDYPATAGLVVGLTTGSESLFSTLLDVPLLIPGLGAQGGDLQKLRLNGRQSPWLINVSRSILYPDPQQSFHHAAAQYARAIQRAVG